MVTGGAITLADGIVLAGAIPGVIGVVELPWSKGAIPLASIPVTSVGSKSTTGLLPALPLPFTFPGAAAGGALTAGGVGINGRMLPLACPCPLLSWGICLGPPKGALASGFGFSPAGGRFTMRTDRSCCARPSMEVVTFFSSFKIPLTRSYCSSA